MIKFSIFFILFLVFCSLFLVPPAAAYDINQIEPLKNPLEGKTVPGLMGSAINGVLGVVGSLALVMFIYGGFQWMTARGNAEQAQAAGKLMLWAALGLAVIFASYLILNLVFEAVAK